MSARVIPIRRSGTRPRRISLQMFGFQPGALRFVIACECGHQETKSTREDARAARRAHQALHTAAESAHPAGKGRVS